MKAIYYFISFFSFLLITASVYGKDFSGGAETVNSINQNISTFESLQDASNNQAKLYDIYILYDEGGNIFLESKDGESYTDFNGYINIGYYGMSNNELRSTLPTQIFLSGGK